MNISAYSLTKDKEKLRNGTVIIYYNYYEMCEDIPFFPEPLRSKQQEQKLLTLNYLVL